MTILEAVRHFNGKRTGCGKWIAHCPVHQTHRPHLSIREGKTCVLLTCWSQGCSVEEIVKAAGLTMQSLFYEGGQKFDPKARAEADRRRKKEEYTAKELRWQVRYWTDEVRKWETVASLLHAHLVHARELPEGPAIARLWRKALATARSRHERLTTYWPKAPVVTSYHLTRVPREITAQFVGKDIAEVLGVP